jgi:hypothetical protein
VELSGTAECYPVLGLWTSWYGPSTSLLSTKYVSSVFVMQAASYAFLSILVITAYPAGVAAGLCRTGGQ